jgi:hypothetical protein
MIHPIPNVWYFPSTYGDIRLERLSDFCTKLVYGDLSPAELEAISLLRTASMGPRCGWATREDWDAVQFDNFQLGEPQEREIEMSGPITEIGRFLRRRLRPGKPSLSVVRIGHGKLQEMSDSSYEDDVSDDEAKAVTTWTPLLGCPAPNFAHVRRRATRVLRDFLDEKQADQFEADQRFSTVGADTEHDYMLTSRSAPDELARFGGRSVFDETEKRAYCVHDWDIPPEEELLMLHCHLSLPGLETWVRSLPDVENRNTR